MLSGNSHEMMAAGQAQFESDRRAGELALEAAKKLAVITAQLAAMMAVFAAQQIQKQKEQKEQQNKQEQTSQTNEPKRYEEGEQSPPEPEQEAQEQSLAQNGKELEPAQRKPVLKKAQDETVQDKGGQTQEGFASAPEVKNNPLEEMAARLESINQQINQLATQLEGGSSQGVENSDEQELIGSFDAQLNKMSKGESAQALMNREVQSLLNERGLEPQDQISIIQAIQNTLAEKQLEAPVAQKFDGFSELEQKPQSFGQIIRTKISEGIKVLTGNQPSLEKDILRDRAMAFFTNDLLKTQGVRQSDGSVVYNGGNYSFRQDESGNIEVSSSRGGLIYQSIDGKVESTLTRDDLNNFKKAAKALEKVKSQVSLTQR